MSSHDRTVTSSGAAFRLQGGRSRQPPLLATLAERRTGRMTGPQTQSYWHKPVHSRASRHHLGILVARKPCTHLWEQPCVPSRSRSSRKLHHASIDEKNDLPPPAKQNPARANERNKTRR